MGPALAVVGEVTIVNVLLEVALPQGAFPAAVIVRVTTPAAMSVALGVYTGDNVVPLANVPFPLVVQFTALWFVAVAPVIITAPLFEHMVWFGPALAVGSEFTSTVADPEAAFEQFASVTESKL